LSKKYDLIVIGVGAAGMIAAITSARESKSDTLSYTPPLIQKHPY